MTLREALAAGRERLRRAQIEDRDPDVWYLLEEAAGVGRAAYFMNPDREMTKKEVLRYEEILERRARHVPLQYILGKQEFMGLEFLVSDAVLIPRQDTEILVCEILKESKGCSVLDVCTGSGCIIISLVRLGGVTRAVACDISEPALNLAKENAKRLGAEVEFLQGDLMEPVTGRFDIIVSNPPYIASGEIEGLMPEVRDYEPRLALDGSEDGLVFYRRILAQAGEHLSARGRIWFEIGCDQAEAVSGLLLEHGYHDIRVIQDYSGLDRVVCGARSESVLEEAYV